jgi:CubicO group peptidase (beta-lactamase class C family)
MFANDWWTVWIYDVADEVGGKRSAAINLMFESLLPKGYERESFAGMEAHELDDARIAELTSFVERGLEVSGVPGTSVGIIQDGEVVFSDGFGVRELGRPAKVDGDTLYMIASNTKGLTTLLLAKLVDEGRIGWKDPVTKIMPGFRLGDEETTEQVLIEHLVCACTGLPRQDMEWILEFGNYTPESSMELLATMQPTSEFGEMFQYSNVLASAAGYVAAHVVHPEHELGTAYDKAMQSKVFDPLGMAATTFDYGAAQETENHARPHSVDVNGDPAVAVMGVNYAAIPVRPAGAGERRGVQVVHGQGVRASDRARLDGSIGGARRPLSQRGARRHPGAARGRRDHVRFRRMAERGRLAREPRRHDVVHDDRARLDRAGIRRR